MAEHLESRTPIPDPTVLTTQQLVRELSALKEVIFTRLSGMDKALDLATATLNKVPSEIDKEITHLKVLIDAKFEAIDKRFRERDARFEQSSVQTKEALDVAFGASEKAMSKAETSFTKQFDQLNAIITTKSDALSQQLSDLKERFLKVEGRGEGQVVQRQSFQEERKTAVSIVAAIVAAIGVAVGVAGMVFALK
jgi:predicted HNH restriction endonuclease